MDKQGLYSLPTDGAEFTRFCGGNLQSEHESCVDVAELPGTTEAFAIRDSKPEGAGRELRFTADEMDTFALGWAKKRGLTL